MDLQKVLIKRRIVCHIIAATFAVLVVAPISFMIYDRDIPFDLRDGFTVPKELVPGEPYKFNWMLVPNKIRNCSGTVYWEMVDSQQVVWIIEPQKSLFTTNKQSSPHRVIGRERILPNGLPAGEIKLYSTIEFVCNPIHNIFPIKVTMPIVHSVVKSSVPDQR